MYLLGIDLGTSALKSLLISQEGSILASASESYPLDLPKAGWSEQDPLHWWEALIKTVQTLAEKFDLTKIKAISFSGQMHGLVALDEEDSIIRPAILWNDTRTSQEVQFLNEEIGRETLIAETGNIAYAGFTLPKILWMRKNEPELFQKIKKIMLPKDYLVYRLTGKHACDYSDASGMLLLDVRNKQWSQKMMEIAGIAREQLGDLCESFDVVGNILPEFVEILGLSPECKIVMGAGDNAAAAIGTGTIGDSACNISLGTSGTIFITSPSFVAVPNSELHSFCHADGKYHVMGCMLTAASANKWWLEDILGTDDYAAAIPDDVALGENSVYFMPYLMGERSPHNDEDVRGAFLGLSLSTSRVDMNLAVLEGVCFALRDCLEVARAQGIEPQYSKVSGGGAKSTIWKKLLANILNIEIVELDTEEGPALGAAILAGVGAGVFSSIEEANQLFVKERNRYVADAEIQLKYERAYQKHKLLYPALAEFYKK